MKFFTWTGYKVLESKGYQQSEREPMEFKVGDRVEAIEPPVGVEDSEADQVGPGELIAINPKGYDGETHKVLLDSGDSWWYSEDRLRHPIVSKPTPTPSITVGTQVRLTGEVVGYDSLAHPERVEVAIEGARTQSSSYVWVKKSALEVIRQPFKRGEVVWSCGAVATGIAYQVLADETDSGDVLLIKESNEGGNRSFVAHHSDFERRP